MCCLLFEHLNYEGLLSRGECGQNGGGSGSAPLFGHLVCFHFVRLLCSGRPALQLQEERPGLGSSAWNRVSLFRLLTVLGPSSSASCVFYCLTEAKALKCVLPRCSSEVPSALTPRWLLELSSQAPPGKMPEPEPFSDSQT